MTDCFALRDCVARFEDSESRQPTEWENFPIHHTDPFWNAALFDEPQHHQFRVDGPVFTVRGGWAADEVDLIAHPIAGGLMLLVRYGRRSSREIWLEPTTFKAFRDYINTTK